MSHEFSIGPSAGMVRTLAQVEQVAKSAATEITVGTIAWHKRAGNSTEGVKDGATYYFNQEERWSLNALGIPDAIAAEGYKVLLPQMVACAHAHGKKLRVSIACFDDEQELAWLSQLCDESGVDEKEYNASCPNLRPVGGKVIPSYHPETLARHCDIIKRVSRSPLAVKVSPVECSLIGDLAYVIRKSEIVQRLVCINTIANQVRMRNEEIAALNYRGEDGKIHSAGGLAGAPAFEEGLRVVRTFRKHLGADYHYTGVGGIFEAEHLMAYRDAGADGVQIGTAYYEYGPKIFGDIFAQM